jgi:radical SAM superfamily enzyme YgiQ (UPF0313 family)
VASLREPGAVLLVSCYELGHQPLGLAWPKAFLERAGFTPSALDLAVEPLDDGAVARARVAAIAVPMHTALRVGVRAAERIRRHNPACRVVFHGLYAFLNADYLREQVGAAAVLAGESEADLVRWIERLERGEGGIAAAVSPALERLAFPTPSRTGLAPLTRYVSLIHGERRVPAGYVEASRGCLHRCLHCPVPAVYGGRFFAVPPEVVLADVRRLVAAGAGHVTFGDPDFLNGPGHALRLVRALHHEFPGVTYDFTAKIEHILERRALFAEFGATGCVFVVSAVESLADPVLDALEKGHHAADVAVALAIVRDAGIALRPTFIPFTPWAALHDYHTLLDFVEAHDLIDQVDAVQYAIRLLVPPGSLLAARAALRPFLGPLDREAFSYRWTHPDPRMDALHAAVAGLAAQAAGVAERPHTTFARIRALAAAAAGGGAPAPAPGPFRAPPPERPIPARLTEPWFC